MNKLGEQFIHQKDSKLHTSKEVEHEKERKKKKGEKISQKPVDKLIDWFEVIEQTHMGHRDNPRVLEKIKESYYKKHVIKEKEIPESYYENQKRIAREQGHGDIEITDELRRQSEDVIISDQKSTLDNWIDYLTSEDSDSFPTWSKYWAFNGMLKLSNFDKEKHKFESRSKNTIAPFADLNREALAYVVDAIIKKVNEEDVPEQQDNEEFQKLLQNSNFGKLYTWAIEKVTPVGENELLTTTGEWIKYDKNSNHMPLVKSLQGHGTGWCTAGESTAESQLQGGDFFAYYSHDKDGNPSIPRLAMRMHNNQIAEVRGIAADQNIDEHIINTDILNDKLEEFGNEGEKYKKRSSDMKKLTEINKKLENKEEELNKEDLSFLYEIDNNIQGFGYKKDPRIEEILDKRDIKEDLSFITGISKEKISITTKEALSGNIKYHHGYLDLQSLKSAEGLKLPKTMNGNLNLSSLKSAEGLKLPETIDGDLNLQSLKSAEGLKLPETINGHINLGSIAQEEYENLKKRPDLEINS